MESPALVTVIIPVYNREKRVTRAIESVLRQTFEHWNLIVVDDCSTDNSLAVAQGYADPRIRVLKMPRNSGAAAARNEGIRNVTTDFVALLDSDDLFHPQFLEQSMAVLQRTDANVGFSYTGVGDVLHYDEGPPRARHVWVMPERFQSFKKPFLYQLQIGTAAGIIIKRDVFRKAGFFDESLFAAEDTDWFIRACEFYKGVGVDRDLIFKDNDSNDRLTTSYKKNAQAYRAIIEKNRDDIMAVPFLLKRWFYKSMWLNFYCGQRAEAKTDYRLLCAGGQRDVKVLITYVAGLVLPAQTFISFHKRLAKIK